MTDQDESGFTFVDKRRASQDPTDSPTSTTSDSEPTQNAASSASDASDASDAWGEPESSLSPDDGGEMEDGGLPGGHPGAMPRLNVRDRLLMCIDILNQGAWISLGLISDPATGNIEKDLDQAKAAIDSVAFLAEKVEHELDDSTRRELRNLVRDLQLNFVQQSSR